MFPQRGLTLKQLEKEQREDRLTSTAPTVRPKGETPEEKKARKQAVKEQRRVSVASGGGGRLPVRCTFTGYGAISPLLYMY